MSNFPIMQSPSASYEWLPFREERVERWTAGRPNDSD